MRVTYKLSACLLAGIAAILAIDTVWTWQRDVDYFARDMRQDHEIVGDVVAAVVRRRWNETGEAAARAVPREVEEGNRHLSLRWVAVDDVAEAARAQLAAGGDAVSVRDADYQHTYLPIVGSDGTRLLLDVRESLTAEREFSRRVFNRAASVGTAFVAVSALLTMVLGRFWVGRPMRQLRERAAQIGRGEFDADVRVGGGDEFRALAGSINAMSHSLAEARDRVRRETEQKLTALEQLRHADRMATVGQLAAGIAHELGTPLNVAWSLAAAIGSGEIVGDEIAVAANTIRDQSQQMTTIIRQLLDFARPRPPEKEVVDLTEVAARTVQLVETVAQKRRVALAIATTGEAPANVDPSQIQQVLTNLVVNGVQACAPNGCVTVAIGADVPAPADAPAGSRWHRIDVRDTGAGIAPALLPRLFEPFFTTKGVGEGTGLGLSVSHGIVTEHGGRITVVSTPGQGACFSVFLPHAGAAEAS